MNSENLIAVASGIGEWSDKFDQTFASQYVASFSQQYSRLFCLIGIDAYYFRGHSYHINN